jgi:ubiquinone/menaquinone biosynthesis C-methylase UbiE
MNNATLATERAGMPKGTNAVLDRRTLETDNKNLLPLLKNGMKVMDVGCGSGAITQGIAQRIGDQGRVIGLDTSEHLIGAAQEKNSHLANLSFEQGDVFTYVTTEKFDLITSARTLQWLDQPQLAISKMKSLLNQGGCMSILDYNHEKIEWEPALPESMVHFYKEFLHWRTDAGFDNQIADELGALLSKSGLNDIRISDESELSKKEDPEFQAAAGIWNTVAETRGQQMVKDSFITEEERLAAIRDYTQWLNHGSFMKMYLLAATGYNS